MYKILKLLPVVFNILFVDSRTYKIGKRIESPFDFSLRTVDLEPEYSWKINKTIINSSFPTQYKLFTCHCGKTCPCECDWTQRWCPTMTAEDGTVSCTLSSSHVEFIGSVKVRAFVPLSFGFEDECSCETCQCSKYVVAPCSIPQESLYFSSPSIKLTSIGEKDVSFTVTLPVDKIFCLSNLIQVTIYFTIKKTSVTTKKTSFVKNDQVSFIENASDSREVHNHCINNVKTRTINMFNLTDNTNYSITTSFVVYQKRFANGISSNTTVSFTTKNSSNSINESGDDSNVSRIFVFVIIAILVLLMCVVIYLNYSNLKKSFKKNMLWKPNEFESFDSYLKVLFTQQSFQTENNERAEINDNIKAFSEENFSKIKNETISEPVNGTKKYELNYKNFENLSDDEKSFNLGSQSTVEYSYCELKLLDNSKKSILSEDASVKSNIKSRYVPKSSI